MPTPNKKLNSDCKHQKAAKESGVEIPEGHTCRACFPSDTPYREEFPPKLFTGCTCEQDERDGFKDNTYTYGCPVHKDSSTPLKDELGFVEDVVDHVQWFKTLTHAEQESFRQIIVSAFERHTDSLRKENSELAEDVRRLLLEVEELKK